MRFNQWHRRLGKKKKIRAFPIGLLHSGQPKNYVRISYRVNYSKIISKSYNVYSFF